MIPPPKSCRRCGSRILEITAFETGRDWEIMCFMCGDLYWTRRRNLAAVFQKYRYARDGEDEEDDPAPYFRA